jgi:hypothetical protein
MVDHALMLSLLTVIGVFSANAVAAWKYGADSRQDTGRKF